MQSRGACGTAIPFSLIAWGERWTDAGVASVLNSMTPVFAFILSGFMFHTEIVTTRKIAGVLLGVLGVAVTTGKQTAQALMHGLVPELGIVVASLFYAGAAVYGKRFADLDPIIPAAGSLLASSALLIPIALLRDHSWALRPSTASIVSLFCLSAFSTALAFLIYFRLIVRMGSLATTTQSFLRAPVGMAVAALTLGETITWNTWAGCAMIACAVAALTVPCGVAARRVRE